MYLEFNKQYLTCSSYYCQSKLQRQITTKPFIAKLQYQLSVFEGALDFEFS